MRRAARGLLLVLGGGLALYAAAVVLTFLAELLRALADEVDWFGPDED